VTFEEVAEWFKGHDLTIKQNGNEVDVYYGNEITCCSISGSVERLKDDQLEQALKEILLWASRPRPQPKPKKTFSKKMSDNAKKKRRRK
jgi:hypothetical protein